MNRSIPKVHFITLNGDHFTITMKEGDIKVTFLYSYNRPVCYIEDHSTEDQKVYINKLYYEYDSLCLKYLPKVLKKPAKEIKRRIQNNDYTLKMFDYE